MSLDDFLLLTPQFVRYGLLGTYGRFAPAYLAGAMALVLVVVLARRPLARVAIGVRLRRAAALWRYLRRVQLNARVLFGGSSRTDVWISLVNASILILVNMGTLYLVLSPALGLSSEQSWTRLLKGDLGWLLDLKGGVPLAVEDSLTLGVFLAGVLLARETGYYWVHRLSHQSAVLWQFHKLHHTCTSMTPLSVLRHHPVGVFLLKLGQSAAVTGWIAAFQAVTGLQPAAVAWGILIGTLMRWRLFVAPLRHSQIPLRFPRFLEYVVSSPSLHQAHHDRDRMRSNYADVFSLADWVFGTLYLPTLADRFRFGVAGEAADASPAHVLLEPFVTAARLARGRRSSGPAPDA